MAYRRQDELMPGSHNSNPLLDLIRKGFVGVAVGGGPTPDLPEVGVIHLPATSKGYDKSKHKYKRLEELPTYGHKYKRWKRKGFPIIQHIGPGGENRDIFLFGWSPMSGWEPKEHEGSRGVAQLLSMARS